MYKLLLITTRWDAMPTTTADFPRLKAAEDAYTAVKEQSKKFNRTHIEPLRLYDLEVEQAKGVYIPGEF